MTGSRKKNKPHHPSQTIPSQFRATRILAARNEARRKFNEMQRREGLSGNLTAKPKDDSPELPFAAHESRLESEEDVVDDGFMIVSLPGEVEVPVVDKKKAAEIAPTEEKAATDGNEAEDVKSTGSFWPWSRGTSK